MSVVIVDYGMANLRSVQKAFEKVGHAAVIASDLATIAAAERVVLPGVGAFGDAIGHFRATGLDRVITEFIATGRPFLGICLGLQMLFERSFELGEHVGLGIWAGDVVRFPVGSGVKVPHMGWNTLAISRPDCPLLAGIADGEAVYFVHSYFAVPRDQSLVVATADHPTPFAAVLARDNVFAVQFHPEKSQDIGLAMLANFARLSAFASR